MLWCRYDYVFNTAGPVAHQFCLKLCKYEGLVVTTLSSQLASDTFGLCLGFMYNLWVRLAHVSNTLLSVGPRLTVAMMGRISPDY